MIQIPRAITLRLATLVQMSGGHCSVRLVSEEDLELIFHFRAPDDLELDADCGTIHRLRAGDAVTIIQGLHFHAQEPLPPAIRARFPG